MDSLSNTPKQASAAEKSTGCCGGKSDRCLGGGDPEYLKKEKEKEKEKERERERER